jgi:hypothetical protein
MRKEGIREYGFYYEGVTRARAFETVESAPVMILCKIKTVENMHSSSAWKYQRT